MASPANWGPEFVLNTETAVSQYGSRLVTLPDGGFAAVWVDNSQFFDGNTGYLSIRAQIFDPSGAKLGSELIIDEIAFGDIRHPAVAVTPEGDLIVTWSKLHEELTDHSFQAKKITTDGVVLIDEFRVSTSDSSTGAPEIEVLADGKFIIAWPNSARMFNADGSPLGDDFPTGFGVQSFAELPDGRFIAAYGAPDGSATGVFAQIYNSDGSTDGAPIAVNTQTFLQQAYPHVTTLVDGKFAVVWVDSGRGGNDDSLSAIHSQVLIRMARSLAANLK